MAGALIEGLREAGCDVIDIGPGAHAAGLLRHLPPQHRLGCCCYRQPIRPTNGFKIVIGGGCESAIQGPVCAHCRRPPQQRPGRTAEVIDVTCDYIERVTGDIQIDRRLKVVGGLVATAFPAPWPRPCRAISGARSRCCTCDVDGTFPITIPTHPTRNNLQGPDPHGQADGRRPGPGLSTATATAQVVTRQGDIIYPDRTLMLFAMDVLARNPGASIIYDEVHRPPAAGDPRKMAAARLEDRAPLIKGQMKKPTPNWPAR